MTRVVIVSGAIANKPRSGGEAWVRLSWISGLKRLGFDVYFIEQIAPSACVDDAGNPASFADSVNRQHFTWVTGQAGLAATTALILADPATGRPLTCHGLAWDRVVDLARNAEMLINISGHLTLPDLMPLLRKKLYIDIDPGYTQCWHADPASAFRLAGHDAYFTIGAHVGSTASSIPVDGIQWVPVRQPVVLDDWPIAPAPPVFRFTTVSSWRGAFGPITLGDRTFTLKAHEFRKFVGLPDRARAAGIVEVAFEIALDIHPADSKDSTRLRDAGWTLLDPKAAAGDVQKFGDYVRGSSAEFSVAQGIYVETNSGWFSDRTIRYLASGRPALVQETGFSAYLPTGRGLVPFRNMDEAVDGCVNIVQRFDVHSAAARRIAVEHFDSDRVLTQFLKDVERLT